MAALVSQKSCCGPFVQQVRRLQQLTALVETHMNPDPGGSRNPDDFCIKTQRELETVRNWISSHVCYRAQVRPTGRSTRF